MCLPLVPCILFAVLLLEGDFLRLFFFFNLHGDADIILMTFPPQSFPSDFPLLWDAYRPAHICAGHHLASDGGEFHAFPTGL